MGTVQASNMRVNPILVKQEASINLHKIALDSSTQDTEALKKMMERSLMPNLGGNIDMKG